jgi:hypothetical protein
MVSTTALLGEEEEVLRGRGPAAVPPWLLLRVPEESGVLLRLDL